MHYLSEWTKPSDPAPRRIGERPAIYISHGTAPVAAIVAECGETVPAADVTTDAAGTPATCSKCLLVQDRDREALTIIITTNGTQAMHPYLNAGTNEDLSPVTVGGRAGKVTCKVCKVQRESCRHVETEGYTWPVCATCIKAADLIPPARVSDRYDFAGWERTEAMRVNPQGQLTFHQLWNQPAKS